MNVGFSAGNNDWQAIRALREQAQEAYERGELDEEGLERILDIVEQQEEEVLGGVQHSISPTFAAEIDNWDGKSKRVFKVGNTSEALMSIGVRNQGIIWHSGKITKIMRDHSAMTKDVIKQVPEILEHPVAVLASKQSDSRLVIFGTVDDANGDPVTAILELQPTADGGKVMDMTILASAYGKEGDVGRFISGSGLVYLDPNKNRTEGWLHSLGLQLPSDTTTLGSIGNITYPGGKVKIESVPYEQYMQDAGENSGQDTRQFSFSESTVNKQDVVADLRAILNRGGDPAELRRYVESMEQGSAMAEQSRRKTARGVSEAEQILQEARRQNVGVEEYLEQNWERYDVDGQWNDAALQALRMEQEQSSRQYSFSAIVDNEKKPSVNFAWAINAGLLTPSEQAVFWKSIAELRKNRYYKAKAKNGEYIIDVGDKLLFTDADFDYPTVSRIIAFKDKNRTVTAFYKEWIYNEARSTNDISTSIRTIEAFEGEESIVEYNSEDFRTDAWQDRQREGTDSGSDSRGFKSRREQYSISELQSAEDSAEKVEYNGEDAIKTLPSKAKNYLKRKEGELVDRLRSSLGVSKFADKNYLKELIRAISNEYLQTGTVSDQTAAQLFETAYQQGIVADSDFYTEYKHIKDHLRTTGVTISEQDRADIADFADFRRRAFGTLKILNTGGSSN